MNRESEANEEKKAQDTASQPETADAKVSSPQPETPKASEAKSAEDSLRTELEAANKALKEAQDALSQQKDQFLRTAAEYDNYRKRTAREKESVYSDATADAVKEFLSVEDNLERALEQKDCSAEDLRKGVEMTQKQLLEALSKLGVTEMDAAGKPFDPALHNAVAHVDDKQLGENVVAKVFQKGYTLNGKVVRHAMVQTAN